MTPRLRRLLAAEEAMQRRQVRIDRIREKLVFLRDNPEEQDKLPPANIRRLRELAAEIQAEKEAG